MSDWEFIDVATGGLGGRGCYGEAWMTKPCLAISKSGITFNSLAVRAFGLHHGTYCRIAFGAGGALIGFRVLSKVDSTLGAARIATNNKSSPNASTNISNMGLGKRLAQYVGHVCELVTERESHMIVAQLDEPLHKTNKAK